MPFSFFKHFRTRETPQTEPIPGKPMVPNSAGGYSFAVDDWKRLERFLILGSEGGSYYASERKLTIENAQAVVRCLDADAPRAIRTIVEISEAGRAPRNDPAVLALAVAAGTGHAAALEVLPRVCRTGTHLFQFAEAVNGLRGWGRGLRKAVSAWYEGKSPEDLAYQIAKYQQREGWSHRDLLRLAHVRSDSPGRQAVYRWIVGGREALGEREVRRGEGMSVYPEVASALPRLLAAMDEARTADAAAVARLIREANLPRECVPTEHLNDPKVWEALLESMPLMAMVRNLGKMTEVGLLAPFSQASRTICERLSDVRKLRQARLHPLSILMALSTYRAGHGLKGKLSWAPVAQVVDALDDAFLKAFDAIEPAGKRTLIGLDVSGSMSVGNVAGSRLTPREAASAMAMVTVRTEPSCQVMAFCDQFVPLEVSARDSLADVVRKTSNLPFGGTDCALPMQHATEHRLEVDTFMVLTDSETWAGKIHPVQALRRYREKTGIPARLVVVGMVANGFTIADPADAGMLDVVGFDTSAPAVIADFSRG